MSWYPRKIISRSLEADAVYIRLSKASRNKTTLDSNISFIQDKLPQAKGRHIIIRKYYLKLYLALVNTR